MGEKLSNVIGAPFSKYILDQLKVRAIRNSTEQRSNEEVLFLANKTGWVRLISSVDIVDNSFYTELELPTSTYNKPESLAKNWILQAGTSKQEGSDTQYIKLRSGFGPDNAYGLGGIQELGYRPMPGLTSVSVETLGKLGSLRQATINFKVHNMNQLNVIEALYFRLGYSMLLEWGHTCFFNNPADTVTNPGGTYQTLSNTFGLDNPFAATNKTEVQQRIAKKSKELSGNYDGMLGIVSSFNWSMNQEGGYDCNVRLIGLGSVIGTIRINQSYKMPESVQVLVTTAQEDIKKIQEQRAKQVAEDEKKRQEAAAQQTQQQTLSIPVPKNVDELYAAAQQVGFKGTREQFLKEVSYYPSNWIDPNAITLTPDYFYLAPESRPEWNEKTFGLFLTNSGTGWKVLHKVPTDFLIDRVLLNTYQAQWRGLGTGTISGQLTAFKDGVIGGRDAGSLVNSGATKLLIKNIVNVPPVEYTRKVSSIGNNRKNFTIYTTIRFDILDTDYLPSIDDFIAIAKNWEDDTSTDPNAGVLTLEDPYFKATDRLLVDRQFEDVNVFATTKEYEILVPYRGTVPALRDDFKKIKAWLQFEFDNTSLIESILPSKPLVVVTPQAEESKNQVDQPGLENKATNAQTTPAESYESALHVMLTTVKTLASARVANETITLTQGILSDVIKVDLEKATKAFYQDGILQDVFNPAPTAEIFNGSSFNVTYYAQKGFNSTLLLNALSNPQLYSQIPSVDFKELSKAYVVGYQNSDNVNYPVYITLGYLLAFLNNMCLIYDSNQDPSTQNSTRKSPYVFIDFNPETNLCLTVPQHLSIDPQVCLIPFEGTDSDYRSILPQEVVKDLPNLFIPSKENYLRGRIPSFKLENSYQGKTMNILLNVDFLMKLAKNFATGNAEHAVYLKDYLEAIVAEVNKSLGNLNLFRVAYDDNSNTVQIKDDQRVPNKSGEDNILNSLNTIQLGELPIFGKQSLVRSLQFKTNVSTKLGSMIAISAQAATGSVNATDASALSYLNKNYRDRFKPYVNEAPSSVATKNTKNNNGSEVPNVNNDLAVADHFNTLVRSIYNDFQLNPTQIEPSKNYYIERVSKVKSTNKITVAAPFIPADLEITIDGIAGILMGNAFTIPESRLPISLRGTPGISKVGFIVAGLVHNIGENQWTTTIRGQMIKLNKDTKYTPVERANRLGGDTLRVIAPMSETATQFTGDVLEDAIKFVKSFEGLYSAQPGKYIPITTITPDTIVYAYKRGADVPTIGWGTTVYATGTKKGMKVTVADSITIVQAEAEIRAEVANKYAYIRNNLKSPVTLTNNQLVTLVSLAYNAGEGNLTGSRIWNALLRGENSRTIAALITEYATTERASGLVLPGLVKRRQQESLLYLS